MGVRRQYSTHADVSEPAPTIRRGRPTVHRSECGVLLPDAEKVFLRLGFGGERKHLADVPT